MTTVILQVFLRNYMLKESQLWISGKQTVLRIRRCISSSPCLTITLLWNLRHSHLIFLDFSFSPSLCKMPPTLSTLCLGKETIANRWDPFRAPLVGETSAMASIISLFWNSASPNISSWRLSLGASDSSTLLIHMTPASLYVMKYIWKQPHLKE